MVFLRFVEFFGNSMDHIGHEHFLATVAFKLSYLVRCVPLPEWTGMGLITGMDYRNGHLYVSLSTFHLVFEDRLA